jgi:acetyl-CoA carboxylase carboxyl transferase subunit alpha
VATQTFDFERPIRELENRLKETRLAADGGDDEARARVDELEAKLQATREEVYAKLTPWERVLFARHKDRPRSLDFIEALTTEFMELSGDRAFGDDAAVVCGTARFEGRPVVVVGQQKGKDTKENVRRNFGMMNPEGYRKALRVMRLADKFGMPILIFVDTPGAYPGLGAEERGQAEAIARNIQEMLGLRVPIVLVVIGEGASGGALGIGLADRILMLENAWYCVISPEGCASILWKDAAKAEDAARALKLTAQDLVELGVIDGIIPEPLGGAHRDPHTTYANVGAALQNALAELDALAPEELMQARFDKYRAIGEVLEG